MGRIFNTSWGAVIVAVLVFYMLGFFWYGFLFSDAWMAEAGISEAEALANSEAQGVMMFVWGILVTLGQAMGLLMVLEYARATRLSTSLKIAFWLVITIVAPVLAYASLYQNYSGTGFMIDFGHMLIGYLAMAAVYALFRGKGGAAAGES